MSPLRPKERADRVRGVPLEGVLRLWGAQPDRSDPCQGQTPRGTLSMTGAQFMNWTRGVGGGGAIDLVMPLNQAGFREALQGLEQRVSGPWSVSSSPPPPQADFQLPPPQPGHRERVVRYWAVERALPADLIQRLIQWGTLDADHRAHALFVLLGKGHTPVGAARRGPGP